jgi:hypothetical protein
MLIFFPFKYTFTEVVVMPAKSYTRLLRRLTVSSSIQDILNRFRSGWKLTSVKSYSSELKLVILGSQI